MKAVIFDMDGTLVDNDGFIRGVMDSLYAEFGIEISDEDHLRNTGKPMRVIWAELKNTHGLPHTVDELLEMNKKRYFDHHQASEGHILMPGILEVIQQLKSVGVMMGVSTSASRPVMEKVLDELELAPFMDGLSSADDVAHGKPAPDIFLRTAELMGVEPGDCVVFEDAAHGITGAKAAKMKCVGYAQQGRNRQDLSAADLVVHDYQTLNLEDVRQLW